MKLHDSELKVMEILWEKGTLSAKELSVIASQRYDWNKNTTYTVAGKLVDKGAVQRADPGFLCTPLTPKEDVQRSEMNTIIDKLWDGSKKAFFSAFAKETRLSDDEIQELLGKIEED